MSLLVRLLQKLNTLPGTQYYAWFCGHCWSSGCMSLVNLKDHWEDVSHRINSRMCHIGLTRWYSGKDFPGQCRRCRFDPWVGKIPWRRKWQHTPVFCLENSMDRGIWWAILCPERERDRETQTQTHRHTNTHTHTDTHTHDVPCERKTERHRHTHTHRRTHTRCAL